MMDDVFLTYAQAMKITKVLVWTGKQEGAPITLEEAKELAKHLYYRSSTKPREELDKSNTPLSKHGTIEVDPVMETFLRGSCDQVNNVEIIMYHK